MITSGPALPAPIPLCTPIPLRSVITSTNTSMQTNTDIHTHTQTRTHIIMHTCWPVLLRRREMLSNSAFQHSTSDYLFSFTGRFELVMYFPFNVELASLSVSLSLSLSYWESLVPVLAIR